MRYTSDRCGSRQTLGPLSWASDFDRVLGLLQESNRPQEKRLTFPIDVLDLGDRFVLQAELAGFSRQSIEVEVKEETLTIRAERERPAPTEGAQVHLAERRFGRFERSLNFVAPVDFDRAEAKFEEGLLTLSIPKSAKASPRRIPIGSESSPADIG